MVKIVSINSRGINNKEKREAIFKYHRFNADILIVHESHGEETCQDNLGK